MQSNLSASFNTSTVFAYHYHTCLLNALQHSCLFIAGYLSTWQTTLASMTHQRKWRTHLGSPSASPSRLSIMLLQLFIRMAHKCTLALRLRLLVWMQAWMQPISGRRELCGRLGMARRGGGGVFSSVILGNCKSFAMVQPVWERCEGEAREGERSGGAG